MRGSSAIRSSGDRAWAERGQRTRPCDTCREQVDVVFFRSQTGKTCLSCLSEVQRTRPWTQESISI